MYMKSGDTSSLGWGIGGILSTIRNIATRNVRKFLPSPHSELLLGLTFGIDDLSKVPRFNDVLRSTGTIHVVVVSGYNISLVFDFVVRLIGSKYRLKNLVVAQFITLLYALLCGFEPPVVRSWIMGSIVSWGKYYGRGLKALEVLVFSAMIMLLVNPSFLFSLSFQLSFLATLSLVLYTDYFAKLLKKFPLKLFKEDLISTLSAQVLVWPLISYSFGQVSLISPLVNTLILWTIPLATVLGGALLVISLLLQGLPFMVWYIVYVPLDIFVIVVKWFASVPFASISYGCTLTFLAYYYSVVLCGAILCRKRVK